MTADRVDGDMMEGDVRMGLDAGDPDCGCGMSRVVIEKESEKDE